MGRLWQPRFLGFVFPIRLLIPCHRVIGKDATPGGYGGGVWRKQWLLAHEQKSAR